MSKLYVSHLSENVRYRDLEDLFGKFGKIRRVTPKNGFAFVEFEDKRDAEDALKDLRDTEFMGRRIRIDTAFTQGELPIFDSRRRLMPGEGRCNHCRREGHWKRECPYLRESRYSRSRSRSPRYKRHRSRSPYYSRRRSRSRSPQRNYRHRSRSPRERDIKRRDRHYSSERSRRSRSPPPDNNYSSSSSSSSSSLSEHQPRPVNNLSTESSNGRPATDISPTRRRREDSPS